MQRRTEQSLRRTAGFPRAQRATRWSVTLGTLLFGACRSNDSSPPPTAHSATPTASAVAPATPRSGLDALLVDADGALLDGERIRWSSPDANGKLTTFLGSHPLRDQSLRLTAERTATASDVAKTINAFGDAGAKEIAVRTADRDRKDVTQTLVPPARAGTLPECTTVVAVLKSRATAAWSLRAGTASKYARGMAGPDLSSTVDGVSKRGNACAAKAVVVAGEEGVEWGLVFDLVRALASADPPLHASSFVVPGDAVVAGKPVKLSRP